MSIIIQWDNAEQTVIRLDYAEPILMWGEYDNAVDESYQLACSVTHRVDIIHNAGKVNMPKGSAFPHVQRAMRLLPANVGITISVVENLFARALLPIIISPATGHKIKFARSLDEARQLVQQERVPTSS